MNITFKNKKLQRLASDAKHATKKLGPVQSNLWFRRLNDLYAAQTLEDIRYLPGGRFHELKKDRKGQWACDLNHPYRLIFTPHNNPIPTNEHGQYIWLEIVAIEILEIVDYH